MAGKIDPTSLYSTFTTFELFNVLQRIHPDLEDISIRDGEIYLHFENSRRQASMEAREFTKYSPTREILDALERKFDLVEE